MQKTVFIERSLLGGGNYLGQTIHLQRTRLYDVKFTYDKRSFSDKENVKLTYNKGSFSKKIEKLEDRNKKLFFYFRLGKN